MRKTPSAKPETRPALVSRKPAGVSTEKHSWQSLDEFASRSGFLAPSRLGSKKEVR